MDIRSSRLRTKPVAIAQVIIGAAAAMAMLYVLRTILVPVAVAFVLAVLVDALVRWIVRRWPKAPQWAVVALAGLSIAIAAFGAIFVIVHGGVEIVQRGPALLDRLDQLLLHASRELHLNQPLRLSALVGDTSVAEIAGNVLSSAQDVVSGLFLMLVYFGFMLASRERLAPKIRNIAVSSERAEAIRAGIGRIAGDIETYIWVQTLTGLMLAIASAVVMYAVGLDNVPFWTIVLFLLSYIPIVGVTVGSIAPAMFALLQFQSAWQASVVFAGIQLIALIVGNLIYPRMQAQTQNIDPVATILALSFWGFLWGTPGAFLAVPLTLMLMMVCAQFDSTRWVAILLSNDGEPYFPGTMANPSPEAGAVG